MKLNRCQKLILNFALPIVLAIVLIFFLIHAFPKHEEVKKTFNKLVGLADILDKKDIEQSFRADENGLSGVGFQIKKLKDAKNLEKDILQCTVLDESGRTVTQQDISGIGINNDLYSEILFDPIPNSKNERFVIRLTPVSKAKGQDLYTYTGRLKDGTEGAVVDGRRMKTTLVFSQIYNVSGIKSLYIGKNSTQLTVILIISVISIFLLSFLIVAFVKRK